MKNLENLTIHSFRGLPEICLESLGQINLFVGVNNSGKTSVLEAISTYCRPLDGVEPGIASRPSLEEPDLRFSPHPATGY